VFASLASLKLLRMSKPPVGGGVRRYEAGGGVTERPILVIVQKSGEFVL
jgi:hypothetical protein